MVHLRHEMQQLRREIADLRQQVGSGKRMHARAVEKNKKLEEEIDKLRAENRQLKDKLFGRKSEKKKPKDRSSQLEDPEEASGGPPRQRGHQPQQPGHGRRDYAHLPVIEKTVELPVNECVCPQCGKPLIEMAETEEQLKLYGLDLPPGTVTDGLKRLVSLGEPIYQAWLERNGQSVYRQADETRWPVFVQLEGKKGHLWWLGAFLGEDTVAFRIAPSRGHEVPEGHYPEDAQGVLMVDRYAAYKAMAQVKSGSIKLAFCWSHVRRDFVAVGKGWPELVD